MDEDNDGRFPDDSAVKVHYRLTRAEQQGHRSRWPSRLAAGPADGLVPVYKLAGFADWPGRGLVTFSRLPVSSTVYRGFGVPPGAPGISRAVRLRASLFLAPP